MRGAAREPGRPPRVRGHGQGNRPSFSGAASPTGPEPLYEMFCAALEYEGSRSHAAVFGSRSSVELANGGPVTIVLDT